MFLRVFFTLGVVKYGNAAFSFLVATLSTPLTEFAFAWPWLVQAEFQPISIYNYISLAILVIGVIIYRIFERGINHAQSPQDILHSNRTIGEVTVWRQTLNRSYFSGQPNVITKRVNVLKEIERTPDDSSYYNTYP